MFIRKTRQSNLRSHLYEFKLIIVQWLRPQLRFQKHTDRGRMPSSGLLRCVPLVRTDVSEESSAFIVRVRKIGELGRTLAAASNLATEARFLSHILFLFSLLWFLVTANVVPSTSILITLIMEVIIYSETSVRTRATRRNIPGDGILHFLVCFGSQSEEVSST
jgi:hypothetical protein